MNDHDRVEPRREERSPKGPNDPMGTVAGRIPSPAVGDLIPGTGEFDQTSSQDPMGSDQAARDRRDAEERQRLRR